MPTEYYRRHLPHWLPENGTVFVTWNLKGALPQETINELKRERNVINQTLSRFSGADTAREPSSLILERSRRLFQISETHLDKGLSGPRHLSDPRLAQIVHDSILDRAESWYELFAHVIMPNHVHLLIQPVIDLNKITAGIKKWTARRINQARGEDGTVWQDEAFDHVPRDESSFHKFLKYIEDNPVTAGLCGTPEEWKWSSAVMRETWPKGLPYRKAT